MGDATTPARHSRRRTSVLVAALVAAFLVVGNVVVALYTDALWFREVGYSSVFRTMMWTRIGLGVVFGTLFVVLLLLNIRIVRKITGPDRAFRLPEQISERYRATIRRYIRPLMIAATVLAGVAAGLAAGRRWREYQLWRHHAAFGTEDPVFHKDLGYYMFKLPWQRFVCGWTLKALVVITLVAFVAHYFRGGIRPQRRGERIGPEVRAHLSILVGLAVAVKAWGYQLGTYGLLTSKRGVVYGAGYTDVRAQLPALRALGVAAIVCALLLLANVRFKNWTLPLVAIGLLGTISVVGGTVIPNAVQRLKVKPNERSLEQPFIQRNIDATRTAYGLDGVEDVPYPASGTLDVGDVRANINTIQNIRLWAPEVLQSVNLNLQRVKQYYTFVSPADADRYEVGRRRSAMMVAAREISPNGLSPDAMTWVNTHLFYTHGYGVVASLADGAVKGGQPDFVVKDVPPVSDPGAPRVDIPQIYYGENEEVPFVIVGTKQGELDHPTSDGSAYATTDYNGTGGVGLGGVFRRAAFAWRFRDINVLISGAITGDSRVMFRRRILDRVATIAPFLQIEGDPYLAVADGRLVWIVDGYTTSAQYPYSQPADFGAASGGLVAGRGNYIRDAVKFVVDAKNGTVDGYVWDETDAVLRAWMKVFPGLFKPRSQMPAAVAAHVRYPQGFFQIQSDRLADYHVRDAGSFYQKEDAWLVGRDPTWCLNNSGKCTTTSSAPPVPPYYMLATLPGESEAGFVLVRPFTPAGAGRQNMVGYLVGYGDPGHYGRLVTLQFPRSQQIFGPEQVEANINQDPAVTQQVSLWNQQHSKVIYGNLLIVPIADSLLYVQPLYLRGEGSQIPELKRVVVVANGRVEMADTLTAALAGLLER